MTEKVEDDYDTDYINESILNTIIIQEFTKSLHTKEVDEENREGYFLIYKRLINRIIKMVNEVNSDYPYAKSLVSSIVEGSLHQHFLMNHLKHAAMRKVIQKCKPFQYNGITSQSKLFAKRSNLRPSRYLNLKRAAMWKLRVLHFT